MVIQGQLAVLISHDHIKRALLDLVHCSSMVSVSNDRDDNHCWAVNRLVWFRLVLINGDAAMVGSQLMPIFG